MEKLIARLKQLAPAAIIELDDDNGFVLVTEDVEPVLWTPDKQLADLALKAAQE